MTEAKIHPTAVIGSDVEIAAGTTIGPFCIIEDHVKIGPGNTLLANVYVGAYTEIGEGNTVFPYTTLGLIPQDLKFGQEVTRLVIGNNNKIREHVTIHRGTEHGGGTTKVGNDNLFMVGSHAAHDCRIGDRCILSHGCALAGHVIVGDDATVGAASSVHQFCHVGNHAFIGGHSVVVKDALPYIKTVGNRAKIYGVNTIGLERKGFSKEDISAIKSAYRILFLRRLPLSEALSQLDETYTDNECVKYLADFIRAAQEARGITR
ncbi:MAG: acyl-ACP--UDP-N-acetylglucosamine O-acyltransferase [Acidobacteriota bacterium]|nr:acyl-ACP--UDP-N-acetylglucosamine O-acyltransferase [Acidobacteriota bacterium]